MEKFKACQCSQKQWRVWWKALGTRWVDVWEMQTKLLGCWLAGENRGVGELGEVLLWLENMPDTVQIGLCLFGSDCEAIQTSEHD